MRAAYKIIFRFHRLAWRFWHWAQRRFTLPGLVLAGALCLTGMMGMDTDNTVTYQAFSLVFFLLAMAVVFTVSFRVRFSATRLLPRFGTVGHPLSYTLRLRNLG